MTQPLHLKAYAKVNLGLDVLRRREDGYHEVRMIMQTVKLFDYITLQKNTCGQIRLSSNLPYLPLNEKNLVYRAIDTIRTAYNISDGVDAAIEKHIPVAAGMAGGSTDAAAALVGMNQLFSLGITQDELIKHGLTLGADIPFCIMRGTALSEGIGEILTPLPSIPACWFLIVKPTFSMSTKFVLKLLGMKTEDEEEAVTEEEVKALLKMGNESGTFDDDEKEMIDSVFKFDRRTAREIMVPRREVIAFDIDDPFEEMIDEILETRHNRIPVYEENIDNIIGVLHVKDMMIEMRKHPLKKGDVRQMLRQPFFIPETKEADELFRIMQETRHHMALLVDEYGGFSGIVTIENLVEEIMGDINEEYEEVVPEIECVREDEYKIDGGVLIDDLNDELGLKLETENYDTLSGYLIEKLGHIPAKEDRDIIETDGLIFKIEEVKDNRITQVRLRMKDLK